MTARQRPARSSTTRGISSNWSLDSTAEMPASAARRRTSSSTRPLHSRICSPGSRARSMGAASNPSIRGIRASITTTSGASSSSCSRADSTPSASPTISSGGPASCTIVRIRNRTPAWSSTIIVRTAGGTIGVAQYARPISIRSPAMPAHDVLIIGAGLAGQRAALAAAEAGATVAIMSKVHPVRSHSNAAAGGINAALNPDDSWESHAFDTVKGSDYLGDQDAIEIMCREAPDEVLWLEHHGVTFHRNAEGKLGTRAFGGASAARTYYIADITGQALLHVLYEQLMKHDEVYRYEESFVTALVRDDQGHIAGCVTRNIRDGAMELFAAKTVIVASGGNGQGYNPTTNALVCTGDGIAMAYRIGAPLMDMEM